MCPALTSGPLKRWGPEAERHRPWGLATLAQAPAGWVLSLQTHSHPEGAFLDCLGRRQLG